MTHFRNCFRLALIAATLITASSAIAQNAQVAVNAGEALQTQAIKPETDAIKLKPAIVRSESLDLSRVGVQTAQPTPLSLADAVRRALEANNTIEVTRGDVRFQATVVEAQRGLFDPVFTATPTFTQNSTTGSAATHDFRVNSNLRQLIGPGGGDYTAFFNNSRTENAFAQAQVTSGSITSSSSAIYSSGLGVNYNQPLFRNFGIDSRRQQLRIAKRRLEETDLDFRNQAITTIQQVQRSYWDLVFALRDQQNRVANVNLARENLRQVEAKIEAGASAPLERAQIATELANRESDLLLATQQVSINENTLKQLLLRDAISAEWEQSFVPTDVPTVDQTPINIDAVLKDAIDNRYELQRLKLERDVNQIDIKFFKNQTKPQIDLNTSFSLAGFSRNGTNAGFTTNLFTSPGDLAFLNGINQVRSILNSPTNPLLPIDNPIITIPPSPSFLFGGFNQSLSNLFRSDAPNFTIGVTISFPFRNRTAKANLAGARVTEEQLAARTRSEEQVVVVEVRNAAQAVETARQRVAVAITARENAEIQLEGERKLYEAGKSTTFLLFQRENELTNARNAEISSQTDYRKALADLQRATSTTFRDLNIDIQSPVAIH
jgi:Outer membrane protein